MDRFRDKETGQLVSTRQAGHYYVTVYRPGSWLPESWDIDDFRARFEPVGQPKPGSE